MSRRWRRSMDARERTDEDRAAMEARISAAVLADDHARGAHEGRRAAGCPACNPASLADLAESQRRPQKDWTASGGFG